MRVELRCEFERDLFCDSWNRWLCHPMFHEGEGFMSTSCQSCGMPLDRDPEGGGTETDGSRSRKYCSYCYENGAFVSGDMLVGEFQEACRKKMIEAGHNRFSAWLFTRGMKRLERWKTASS